MSVESNSISASGCDGVNHLERSALRVRASCVQMAHDGKEGHLSSALSVTDILVALYGGWLNVSPDNPQDPGRDRLLFSKGHAVTALYAVLAEFGFMPKELLKTYAKSGSALPNHPCRHGLDLLEISSGSLGHGLGMGTGMAYGFGLDGVKPRVAVVMSDGETNEGSVWESAMFAAAHKLDNLLAIVDNNNLQAVGRNDQLNGFTSLEEKFKAFGWNAVTVNGNNMSELVAALAKVPFGAGKPSAIIAKTVGGFGVSFMEDQTVWHYRCPPADEVAKALAELGEAPLQASAP